ncbi:MAG TPA: molybdopterin-binding protein [Thermoguttaceae bacterium]|nr:molybdopterin-binding protein [Thermoguttaceae bacterium]
MTWFRPCPLALVLCAVTWGSPAGGASPPESARPPVDYRIVVTGGELLSGAYPDGHTYFLTRTLRPLGLRCVGSMSVDDRKDAIQEALRFAAGKAALVIVTGGLGPTDNDVTRETLSEFTGIALEEHPDVLAAMERRFGLSRDQIRPNLRRQTHVPTRGTYLDNPNGTAVGLVFEAAEAVIVALPGPPRELQAMVRAKLVPYLSRRFGTRLPGCSLTLRFVGLGQSQIDQTLQDHVPLPPDVTLSSQFEGGRVDFTFSLPDDTPQDRARLEELKQKILEHLGDYVYAAAETSLEEHVVGLLEARKATLALAEVASGGSLAAGLNDAVGADGVLAGAYVAPTEEKLRRLLHVADEPWAQSTSGAQTAELLAKAAAEATGSQWAVAVGEARQEQGGARYVEVVVRLPDGRLDGRRVGLRGDGELARFRLTTQLLDELRRKLR